MKTLALIAATGSLAAIGAPASAAPFETAPITLSGSPVSHSFDLETVRFDDDDDDWRDRRRYRRGHGRRIYDDRGRYYEPRRLSRRDRVWRGRDGRYYCQRDNGTTGLVIGAVGGALLGRTIDTRGDRTVGTLLGGALGAVLGREIDRGGARCR
ncbi:MAG: glycine zipper 2TM domain-containing protein [Erythrobacter sp.]